MNKGKNFGKYDSGEFKIHNRLLITCSLIISYFIVARLVGFIFPLFTISPIYSFIENIIVSIAGSIIATSYVFKLLYNLDKDKFGILELRKSIYNSDISKILSVKHHVFMLRITSHPQVDECEEKVSEYLNNSDQWDWHICLADTEGYTDVKYNNFSTLLNLFFESDEKESLRVREKLKSTELSIVDYEKFKNEIFERDFYPFIKSVFSDQELISNIKDFHSIILTGIISYEKEEEGMPKFESLIDYSELNDDNLQINRLIFNTPKTRNNHLFINKAADYLGKILLKNLNKVVILKNSKNKEMRLHIPKTSDGKELDSTEIKELYDVLNTKYK